MNPLGLSKSAATIPDHELIVRIGGGSYGEVWLARSALGASRAVKIINRKSFEDDRPFEREFNGIKRFEPISRSHEGLVDILQVGRQQEYFYYVMELADDAGEPRGEDGELRIEDGKSNQPLPRHPPLAILDPQRYSPRTLRQILSEKGRLPVSECVEIGLALTSALAHMHRHGLVHRDIKPSNIIFVQGAPKLADIGLVTEADTTLSYVGTEGYIPPEGPGAIQADIFSLGKVLYEMATGQDRRQFPDLPTALNEWPDRAAVLEVNGVLLKACTRDVRERYQNCEELHADLARLQRGQSVKRHHRWQRRWGFLKSYGLAAAAVALLVLAGLFVNKVRRGHVPNPEAVNLYEDGRWHYHQLTPEAHEKALEALTQATQKDPKFTQPYGEMAMLYTWNMLPGITNEQIRLQKVQEIADKALAIDPKSAEGHIALSWCYFLQRDWKGAEKAVQHAIELNSDLALAHDIYCFYLSMQCRVEEARREGQLSAKQPPISRRASTIIAAWPDMAERRFDLAIAKFKQVLELDRNFVWGYSYLADCYEATSNYVEAIDAYRTSDLLEGKDSDQVNANYNSLRQALKDGGQQGYFRKFIELVLIERALPENERTLDYAERDLAGLYAQTGQREQALKLLEDHFDDPQTWHQIKFMWWFDPLHDEPRFKALVRRAGLEP